MGGALVWGACHLQSISELSLISSLFFGKYLHLSKNWINITEFPYKTPTTTTAKNSIQELKLLLLLVVVLDCFHNMKLKRNLTEA